MADGEGEETGEEEEGERGGGKGRFAAGLKGGETTNFSLLDPDELFIACIF